MSHVAPTATDRHQLTRPFSTTVMPAYLVALLGAIYLPVGRGLIKDDFQWIATGSVASPADIVRVFTTSVGVYRPLVALSFGANYALARLDPLTYGLTNFALLVGCVLGLSAVCRRLGLKPGTSYVAAGLWSLNFHGIATTQLWVSGRTALLLSLFGVLAVLAWLRDKPLAAFVCVWLALFSREEAILLPLLLCAVMYASHVPSRWRLHCALAVVAVGAYLVLRYLSGAFWPTSAPTYYRFNLAPLRLFQNITEYADRSATLMLAVIVALAAATRTRPEWPDRRLAVLAGAWVATGFLPTIAIPARSSLYVVWPTMGLALLASGIVETMWCRQPELTRRRIVVAAFILPVLLYPVYRARNERLSQLATLSSETVSQLQRLNDTLPARCRVVLLDDRSTHANLSEAFGTQLDEVRRLAIPRAASLIVEPPPEGAEEQQRSRAMPVESQVTLKVVKGRLVETGGTSH